MHKLLMATGLMIAFTGCALVEVSDAQRSRIANLHEQGISWSKNPPKGFKPVACMAPAVGWSFLPGAAQIFIQDKIGDAYEEGILSQPHSDTRLNLQDCGSVMIAVSWFPYIYDATHLFGLGGAIQDVNRINNLALLDYIDSQKRTRQGP